MSNSLILEWAAPTKTITSTETNTTSVTIVDRAIGGYTIEHNLYGTSKHMGRNTTETIVGVDNTSFTFFNVEPGTYTFEIRSFFKGIPIRFSQPLIITKTVTALPNSNRISRIPRGGFFNSGFNFSTSTGLVSILNSSYIFTNLDNFDLEVTDATTAQKQISFSSMSNNSSAFWFYDNSTATAETSLPWKAVQVHTDTTSTTGRNNETYDFEYLKEVGASNNGLSVLTSGRTISISSLEIFFPVQDHPRVRIGLPSTHGLATGDTVTISGISGMTELNSQTVVVERDVSDLNLFFLRNSSDTAYIDPSSFTPYTSGGTLTTSSAIRGSGDQDTFKIVGVNTAFETDFSSGDFIKISTSSAIGTEVSTSEYIEVDRIINNHELTLVNSLSRTYSSAHLFKQLLKVDRQVDAILAKITKSSSGVYSIDYDVKRSSIDTSTGQEVNQSNLASKQNVFVETNTQTSTREQTILSSTINTPSQAANRTINAKSDSIGKIGFRGPQIAVSAVDLSTNPIIVTTSAAHGLTDFCKATFSGFTDTKELNGRQYFVKRGDASDANLTTKFRLFDTLNAGVVANVTLSAGGAGMNAGTTVNGVNTTSNGTGSGLTLDVTTNGSGVISSIAIRNGGTNYSEGEAITLVLDASPGNGLGSNSGTIGIAVSPSTGVKFELADSVDGTSGFTSGGSFTNTKMQQINPCTLSLSASIDLASVSSTIANADIDAAVAKSFSSPYVPVVQSWIEWEFGYGGGHAHNTFSDLVSNKNLVVGATITQGSYTGAITYVQDNGSDAAIVNAEQDSDTVPNSTSDVTVTFDGTSAISMNVGTAQTTLVDANNIFQDKSISVAGSTGSITTVGNSTVNLEGKTESPSVATISTISNVFEDDDIVVITEIAHGFTTGTPISFSDVRVINGAAPSAIGSDITSTKNNGLGFNDGVTYFVHKTSERNFKVAKTQDGSDFVHGREFFTGDEEAVNNLYFIATRSTVDHASFVHTNTASIINDVSLHTDAIT